MKKSILFSLAALMLVACSKDDNDGMKSGRAELQLSGSLEAATRGNVQSTQIVENETVWAWVSDTGTGEETYPYNAEKLTAGTGGGALWQGHVFP